MSYYLFLDDERNPSDVHWIDLPQVEWVIARTEEQFKETVLERGMMKFCSFDNDLGTGMGEGRYCAKWLIDRLLDGEMDFDPEFAFAVHSKNPIAAEWINQYICAFLKWRT